MFAYQLLDQITNFPLFRVNDLNPQLYTRVKSLQQTKNARIQLKFIKDFVKSCRFAVEEQTLLHNLPDHVTDDVDIWTMAEFLDVKNCEMLERLQKLVKNCENHIFKCEVSLMVF